MIWKMKTIKTNKTVPHTLLIVAHMLYCFSLPWLCWWYPNPIFFSSSNSNSVHIIQVTHTDDSSKPSLPTPPARECYSSLDPKHPDQCLICKSWSVNVKRMDDWQQASLSRSFSKKMYKRMASIIQRIFGQHIIFSCHNHLLQW